MDWQPLRGAGSLLEEADNAPAGPPTTYCCTAVPSGLRIRAGLEGSSPPPGPGRGCRARSDRWGGAARTGAGKLFILPGEELLFVSASRCGPISPLLGLHLCLFLREGGCSPSADSLPRCQEGRPSGVKAAQRELRPGLTPSRMGGVGTQQLEPPHSAFQEAALGTQPSDRGIVKRVFTARPHACLPSSCMEVPIVPLQGPPPT